MEKWEEGYYITGMAGSMSGGSLVVMSKGTPYTQQSYKVRDCTVHVCVYLHVCIVVYSVFSYLAVMSQGHTYAAAGLHGTRECSHACVRA